MNVAEPRGSIYLCPTEHCPHLTQFAVGVLDHLGRHGRSVAVIRPIVAEPTDRVLDELASATGQRSDLEAWGATADDVLHNPTAAMARIIARHSQLRDRHDVVLVLGSEYDCSLAPIEFS